MTAGNMTRASLFPTKDSKSHLQRQMGMGFFSSFSSSRRKGYFGNLDNALASFNRMLDRNPRPPIIEFNRLLSSVVRMKKYETVVSLFKEMEFRGIKYNVCTLSILINCFCFLHHVDYGFSVFGKTLKRGFKPDVVIFTTLIDGVCRIGKTEVAAGLLKEMGLVGCVPDVVTCNSLMRGYCSQGKIDKVRKIFHLMASKGLKPDVYSYSIFINGYCKVEKIDEAMELFDEMSHRGVVPNAVTYNTLIKALCQALRPRDAHVLFRKMCACGLSPDILAYSTLLDGFCKQGNLDEMLVLFQGFAPSDVPTRIAVGVASPSAHGQETRHPQNTSPKPLNLSFSATFPSLNLSTTATTANRRRGGSALGTKMSATAAGSYALALADVAKSNNTLDATASDIDKIERLFSNPAANDFFTNPTIDLEKKRQVIDEFAKSSSLQPLTANFINILIDSKRVDLVKDIVVEFEKVYNKMTDTQLAVVSSVVALESQHLAQIAKQVQKLTGAKNVRIKTVIDPSLVAGFTVRYGSSGSKMIDMSVKKQLEEITAQLDLSDIELAA